MASNLLRRRWSEKAWGEGGAHEMNLRNLGSPSYAYWLPSLTKEDRISYKSKHTASPAHKILPDSEPLMCLRKSVIRILSPETKFTGHFQVKMLSVSLKLKFPVPGGKEKWGWGEFQVFRWSMRGKWR